jgi:hypothetical protein
MKFLFILYFFINEKFLLCIFFQIEIIRGKQILKKKKKRERIDKEALYIIGIQHFFTQYFFLKWLKLETF